MNLRETAEADLAIVLEDDVTGFGWPITVADPTGKAESLVGSSGDIAQAIDPDTGQAVSGRLAMVTLRISSLVAAGFTDLPKGISSTTSKPWLITFDDINGNSFTFKVQQSNPDRTLGVVKCILELHEV